MPSAVLLRTTTNSMSFTPRRLRHHDELQAWAAFTEQCFSEKKPTPPSREYFLSKIANDPWFKPEDICVLEDESESFVASLRLYHREGERLSLVGIGDVGVAPHCRGQGLANALIDFALKSTTSLALLHASLPSARRTYQRSGFVSLSPIRFLRLQIATRAPSMSTQTFDKQNHVELVCDLYEKHLSHLPGALKRSAEYFAGWVVNRWQRRNGICLVAPTMYVYAMPVLDDNTWRVDEFAGPRDLLACAISALLDRLPQPNTTRLLMSAPLYEHYSPIPLTTEPFDLLVDDGWMSRPGLDSFKLMFDGDAF
jgi:predicted N-acetyltransferase YhbS